MAKTKKKYYAVKKGRKTGIFEQWYGPDGAEAQVRGFSGPIYMSFFRKKDAEEFLKIGIKHQTVDGDNVIIYTDGGCLKNPGPGGYGAVLIQGNHRKELSGGYRHTTNNRMELTACIVALRKIKRKSNVVIHSDSKYVVDGITKGWAVKWKANDWMRTEEERAKNSDLWKQLLELCGKHNVEFKWVKGHAGNSENERCDQLAFQESSKRDLPPDKVYEREQTLSDSC